MASERWVAGALIVGSLVTSAALLRFSAPAAGAAYEADTQARIERGLSIAPVSLDLRGKDRALVGLGSYLVNAAGGCNDCHTEPSYAPGHDPFKGGDGRIDPARYLKGGKKVGEGITSTDLTPDARGLPGGLTLDVYLRAMVHGQDPENAQKKLVVMPWPVYRNLCRSDLLAIYEYLKALPPAKAAR